MIELFSETIWAWRFLDGEILITLNSMYFLFPLRLFLRPVHDFEASYLISKCLESFFFPRYCIMTWEHTLLLQFSYYIWWGLFRAPGSIFILVSVPWVLKKMCTLVVLGGVFYICQIGSLYCSVLLYPCWFSIQ